MTNIAFLASHNGSAAKAITSACKSGILAAKPVLLISNNSNAGALDWAKDLGVDSIIINNSNTKDVDMDIAKNLTDYKIDLVICSGYMKLIGPKTISCVDGKILNIHPALLPQYGGKGMYGRNVHEAVFKNRDKKTGATIHLVDGEYDRGRIIAQKEIDIASIDGVDDIEQKVKNAEPDFYIQTLHKIIMREIDLL